MKKVLFAILVFLCFAISMYAGTWEKIGAGSTFASVEINGMSEVVNGTLYFGSWSNDAGVFRIDGTGLATPTYASVYIKRDFMGFQIDPSDSSVLHGANWNGSYYRGQGVTAAGSTWTSKLLGSSSNAATTVAVNRTNNQQIVLAKYDGVYRSADGGTTWSAAIDTHSYNDVQQSPWDTDLYYLSNQKWDSGTSNGGIYTYRWSTNTLTCMGLVNTNTKSIAFDIGNPGKFYVFGCDGVVSYYDGVTFTAKTNLTGVAKNERFIKYAVCGGAPVLFTAGVDGKINVSTDGATTWQSISSGLSYGVLTMAYDSASGYVYAGTVGGGIWRTQYCGNITPTSTPTCTATPAATLSCGVAGLNWTSATTNAAFPARYHHGMLAFDNGTGEKLWVFGGANASYPHKSDVWYSSNGADWTLATGNAGFGQRSSFSAFVKNGKMWVVSGDSNGTSKSDIWSSSDGVNWVQEATTSLNPARWLAASMVYDDGSGEKLWMTGGAIDSANTRYLNDVWKSSDGKTWTQVTSAAAFHERMGFAGVSYNGKMWICGGLDTSFKSYNDVWYSTNGADWTLATGNAAFGPRHLHSMAVYDSAMWVFGGATYANGTVYTDMWRSTDGVTWAQVTASSQLGTRSKAGTALYRGALWVTGGSIKNDAWYTCGSAATAVPTATFTATVTLTATSTPTFTVTPTPTPAQAANQVCITGDTTWTWTNPATGNTENVPVSGNYVNYANNIAGVTQPIYPLAPDMYNEYNWTDPAEIPITKTFVIPDTYVSQGYTAHFEVMADDYARIEVNGNVIGCQMMAGGTSGLFEYYTGLGCTPIYGLQGASGAVFDVTDTTGAVFKKGTNTIKAYLRNTDCCSAWFAFSMCGGTFDASQVTVVPTSTPTLPAATSTPTMEQPTSTPTQAVATRTPVPTATVADDDSSAYPNPCKDKLKVVFNANKKADYKIYVYDIAGKLLKEQTFEGSYSPNDKLYKLDMNIKDLEPGVYFYVIRGKDEDGNLVNFKTKKFLVK